MYYIIELWLLLLIIFICYAIVLINEKDPKNLTRWKHEKIKINYFAICFNTIRDAFNWLLNAWVGGDTDDLTVTDLIKSIDCISQCVDDATKSNEAWAEIGRQSQKKK